MPPPAPLPDIDWASLDLTVADIVNGHVETTWSSHDNQWTAPVLVKDAYIRVHGLSPALNYGMQAYEGLKATRTADDTITVFRPTLHHRRLVQSAAAVSLPAVPEDIFLGSIALAVRANAEFVGPASSSAILYLRPVLFASGPQLALEPSTTCTLAVYVQPATTYHGVRPVPCLVLDVFDRAATRGTGHAKVGGNYAPVIRHSQEARAKGFYITLHLDSATQSEVEEFSTSGFVGVLKGGSEGDKGTLVVPDSAQIIDSVTSDSLLLLARGIGYKVERRAVKYAELGQFSEVLAVGTAASVLPIAAIVRESTGDKFDYCPAGEPGPTAVELAAAITAVIRGQVEDKHGWRYEITFPDGTNTA
ncbi:amino-transferase class IV domain-containing protein [Hirsutella rhossiliensis]|uniref:Amino-transferase class IV domain-containing protein n=1 Tax=Hirsutella rhossiliensis TaxID=111463 RepID=A0A9P8N0N9_9HYPO|nr:amino-transferase class IV domain-containing protein [Hirsutella rhossiliensis]KAH0963794.1 amino-transferase class IV domain-containing protein [Hirsutella rhossiliensis]